MKDLVKKTRSAIKYYVAYMGFYVMERLCPKSSNIWCFSTWKNYPHTMDNLRAVFEAVKDDPEIIKIILLQGQKKPEWQVEGVNIRFVQEVSLSGVFYLSVAKVYLMGTSLRGFTNFHALVGNKHQIIQLWHGIPLKRIGKLFPPEKFWEEETKKYSATVCSSPSDQEFMQQAFDPLSIDRVWQTGLPRNDFILATDEQLPNDYYTELEKIRDQVAGRFLILYAPTWRDSVENVYQFSAEEQSELDALLARHNAVLAIRGHANVRSKVDYQDVGALNNIIYVNDVPDANLLLKEAGALITDYSSIYIDYLITDRPIVYFTYDIDRYINERGFLYELVEAFVCDPAIGFKQLLTDIECAITEGVKDRARYHRVKSLFHQHADSCALNVVNKIKALN